ASTSTFLRASLGHRRVRDVYPWTMSARRVATHRARRIVPSRTRMLHSLHHFFTHNIGIKLASLILALSIYAHVLSSEDREGVFHSPLQVVGLPEGLTFEGEVPERIPVRIQARGTELWKLRTQTVFAQIDLGEARPGLLQRPVSTQDVVLPPGSDAQVEAIITPVILSLQVETLSTRAVPVAVRLTGDLDPGWIRVGRAAAEPETIRVEGPESR